MLTMEFFYDLDHIIFIFKQAEKGFIEAAAGDLAKLGTVSGNGLCTRNI